METFPTTAIPQYAFQKVPMFNTVIQGYGNKVEQRIAMNSLVRYKFVLNWNAFKTNADYESIITFFIARGGAFEAFYFCSNDETHGRNIWVKNTAYSLNQIVRPVTANGHSYKCTQAGTSGGSTPTWSTAVGAEVNDGTVKWTENTYTVRFADDSANFDYFTYRLYRLNRLELIEVIE